MSDPSFDFIIVGAGSAGCVLADRLGASGRHSVAVIEAGGKERIPLYRLPMLAGRMYRFKINNWWYHTVPQPGMNGREIFLPRGRMVGGSFIFNGMQYVRGAPIAYDSWAQMGNIGWSYRDVLPYFKKSEQYYAGETEFHGGSGPLPVTKPAEVNPLSLAFLEACGQAGHKMNNDFNGANSEGFGIYDFNVLHGRRRNTAHTFLYPVLRRRNTTLITNTSVTRIRLENGRAIGVEVRDPRGVQLITARKEIILAAGAFNTPKILMLSGIGEARHLQDVGIKPEIELKGVGKNLQDHANGSIGCHSKEPVSAVSTLRLDRLVFEVGRAVLFRTGPVSRNVLEAGGFFRTHPGLDAPDCQIVFTPIFGGAARVFAPWKRNLEHSYGAVAWPIYPRSRGEVRLASADPDAAPLIDPNFLDDPHDIEIVAKGVLELRRIFSQPAFDRYRGAEIEPGKDVTESEALYHYIRETSRCGHHACGTAKMGSDNMAVVDHRLRVHRMTGLRIADASITPSMPSGNTNAPVIMIAEKAADMILQDRQ